MLSLGWYVTDQSRHELRHKLPRELLLELLRDPRIWKAGRLAGGRQTLSTGFADLDRALSGGWPVGALIELLVDLYGTGEFRLLMPALMALSRDAGKLVMLVAPPYIPYAPAFVRHGVNISRLLVVRCRRQTDALWVMEQALRSGACAAVLAWAKGADERSLRRLQLAAKEGGLHNRRCWVVLFRPSRFRSQRSPAALWIRLRSGRSAGVSMEIFKNHGGRPRELEVRVPEY